MERLDAAERHPDNQDPTKQFAIQQAKRLLREAKVKDPGPKRDSLPSVSKPEVHDKDYLTQAIEVYQNQPHTPELVTQTYQTIWQARGELVGATYEVPPCFYTQEEFIDLEHNGKRIGYLPPELSTQQTRHILGKMFPKMRSRSVLKVNTVVNDRNPSGWFDYEVQIDAPYLHTTEAQLMDKISKDGRKILSLNQYIVAGQDSKLLTGRYLDEESTCVRLGSRDGGRVVYAYFVQGGRLNVDWALDHDSHDLGLGGRSSGVKKA